MVSDMQAARLSDLNPFWNRPDEWKILDPLVGDSMLELGNKKNGSAVYKKYFESRGIRHVSVDWNGQDGALVKDLTKPLDLGQFAMVTNFGTTEHVHDQTSVWENIHNATEVGGLYIGQTPYYDGISWWWHGEHYPTEDFFATFALFNGWEVERLYTDREPPYVNLYCRMKKREDKPFQMPPLNLIKRNQRRPR